MIKTFRKFRQRLLTENKFSKYLIYAIGEIVLVIIGILCALQINTWNEIRVNRNKLKMHLQEVLIDLKKDSTRIFYEIKLTNKRKDNSKLFLAIEDYNLVPIDTLERHIETYYYPLPFRTSNFEKIEKSGIVNYERYDRLINNLKFHYNVLIPEYNKAIKSQNNAVDKEDNYWRYEQNIYEFKYLNNSENELTSYQDKSVSKSNLVKLIQSPTARNILKIDFRRHQNHLLRLEDIEIRVTRLINDIQNTLND